MSIPPGRVRRPHHKPDYQYKDYQIVAAPD
jgi:hypothetical protein